MKNKRKNDAVSEIIGIAILLGISISLFAVVQAIVLNYPYEPSPPSVNLVGSIEGNNIFIEHYGGESISLDSKILITIGGEAESTIIQLLKDSDGEIKFTYKSDADEIKKVFGMSKKNFKRTLTELIETKKIELLESSIKLI